MKADAITKIQELAVAAAGVQTIEVTDREYIVAKDGTVKEVIPRALPVPPVLTFSHLGSFTKYIKENRDQLDLSTMVVRVAHNYAELLGPLVGEERQRMCYATVKHGEPVNHLFRQSLDHESALLYLQTSFQATVERDALLQLIATVKGENVATSADDGMTQVVTTRSGVALAAATPIPNPVRLRPYCTFREVMQPEQRFIIRATNGAAGKLPTFAFFPVQDDWTLDILSLVGGWLKGELGTLIPVLD